MHLLRDLFYKLEVLLYLYNSIDYEMLLWYMNRWTITEQAEAYNEKAYKRPQV
jgi:hypothetical protein